MSLKTQKSSQIQDNWILNSAGLRYEASNQTTKFQQQQPIIIINNKNNNRQHVSHDSNTANPNPYPNPAYLQSVMEYVLDMLQGHSMGPLHPSLYRLLVDADAKGLVL